MGIRNPRMIVTKRMIDTELAGIPAAWKYWSYRNYFTCFFGGTFLNRYGLGCTFDSELCQIDVNIVFLTSKVLKKLHVSTRRIWKEGKDHLVYQINRSFYSLKHASRQCFPVITSSETNVDQST